MSQSSIDSIEEKSRGSFCLVDETRHPYSNLNAGIPSHIQAPQHPHPHDEPSTADEGEGELILQSEGSSSDESNRISPPSINVSEMASNISVSSSSCLGGEIRLGSTATTRKKEIVVVETTNEQSALEARSEEVIARIPFEAPDKDELVHDPAFEDSRFESTERNTEKIAAIEYSHTGNLAESNLQQTNDETPNQEDTKDRKPRRVKGLRACFNTITLTIVIGTLAFCLVVMALIGTLKSNKGANQEPTVKRPVNLHYVKEVVSAAELESIKLTEMLSKEQKIEAIEVEMNAQGEHELSDTMLVNHKDRSESARSAETLQETLGGLKMNTTESNPLDDLTESPLHATEDIVKLTASSTMFASEEPQRSNAAGFLERSGEWIAKIVLLFVSSFLAFKLSLMATKPSQDNKRNISRVRRPPTSDDVCTFVTECRDRLQRTGRCRRSSDDTRHAKAEFYDCYTKDDLHFICQFLNVANLSKVSRRGKNFVMYELVHCYEDLLWGFTMTEIKSILEVHGMHFKSNANKTALVELAVEAAF